MIYSPPQHVELRYRPSYTEIANPEILQRYKVAEGELIASREGSEYIRRKIAEIELDHRLRQLAFLHADWDTYGAEPPSQGAITTAASIAKAFIEFGLIPDAVTPSAEGGVAIASCEMRSTPTSSFSTLAMLWVFVTVHVRTQKHGPSCPVLPPLMPPFRRFLSIFPLRPFRMYRRWLSVVHLELRRPVYSPTLSPVRYTPRSYLAFRPSIPEKRAEHRAHSVNRSFVQQGRKMPFGTRKSGSKAWEYSHFPRQPCRMRLRALIPDGGFAFFPKHVPLKRNYAHSEVWCDRIPRQNARYVLPTRLVQRELRAKILKAAGLLSQAESSEAKETSTLLYLDAQFSATHCVPLRFWN